MNEALRVAALLDNLRHLDSEGQPVRRTLEELEALTLDGEPLYTGGPAARAKKLQRDLSTAAAAGWPIVRLHKRASPGPGRAPRSEALVYLAGPVLIV